jgi:GT2 family glycosyltransferase
VISKSNILLSVVIVSYNVKEYVIEAIGSVYEFLPNSIQIILVDNNSTDETVEAVKNRFQKVTIIKNESNIGFSAANNQGFAICEGKYVLMLNPDAALIDTSLNKMIERLEGAKEENILLGPKLINTDNSLQKSCWKFPSPVQHLLELFFLNSIINTTSYNPALLQNEFEVDFLSGACILMKHSTLTILKGLDVNLFWMDDVDFAKRNRLIGGLNYYYPFATVKHHIGQSSKKNQNIVISNQIISKLKFYKKHKQYIYFYLSIPVLFLQIITRIPIFFILSFLNNNYKNKTNAYFYTFKKYFSYLFLGNKNLI